MAKNLVQFTLLIFALNVPKSFGQEVVQNFNATLRSPTDKSSFILSGDVDFSNSFIHVPYPEYYRVYQNLLEISLTNSDSRPIRNPFVSLNGSRLWKYPSDIGSNDVLSDDFDRSALLIWRTFTDQLIHRYYPFNGYRAGTPVEVLTVFGYGICYNRAAAVARLPFNESKIFYDLFANKHTVPEFGHRGESAIIDTDLNSFYLNLSNDGLSDKDIISKDRYLIKRTHHYGRQYEYDKILNEYIANFYSPSSSYNYTRPILPSDFSLEYELAPGECMTLDYLPGKYFFSEYYFSANSEEIANGYFSYDWNKASNNYFLTNENLHNLKVVENKMLKTNPELPGSLNIQLKHGFQIVFLEFSVDLGKEYTIPPVAIEVSSDSLNWLPATEEMQDGNMFKCKFDLQRNSFQGKIFIRLILSGDDVEIGNFKYTSYFQINRLVLPQLKLGTNSVQILHDSDDDKLFTVDIKYKEKTSSMPLPIQTPEFPLNGQLVYGPLKEFSWIYPGDNEDIINYEFILTQDTLTHLPLSPNFLAYTNGINYTDNLRKLNAGRIKTPIENQLNPSAYKLSRLKRGGMSGRIKENRSINKFIVHEEGFLNSGNLYFWRVRPLSSNGVWGPWSRYFSFEMEKVMPPVDLIATETELTWNPNPVGARATSFEVYGSNEYLGFEPKPSDLISITSERKIQIKDVPFAFFRVISVDSLGYKSEISEYASRPYPYLIDEPREIYPDSLFQYQVSFTPAFFSMVSVSDEYVETVDVVKYNILKMPPWLKFNYENLTFEGMTSEEMLKSEFYSGNNEIELEFISEVFPKRKNNLKLKYAFKNEKPQVSGIDTILYSNIDFSFAINYSDNDTRYGDSVVFKLMDAPSWIEFYATTDQIVFFGKPLISEGNVAARLIAFDKYGDTTEVEVSLRVVPNKVRYQTTVQRPDTLKLAIDEIPFHQNLLVSGGAFQLGDDKNVGYRNFLEGDFIFIVGDFCRNEPVLLTIPVKITTTSIVNAKFELQLEVLPKEEIPLIAYQPLNTSQIFLRNESNCFSLDVSFTLFSSSGQVIVDGNVVVAPHENSKVNIEGVLPGVYIFSYNVNGRSKRTFRIIKF